jgi:hypothetical protein
MATPKTIKLPHGIVVELYPPIRKTAAGKYSGGRVWSDLNIVSDLKDEHLLKGTAEEIAEQRAVREQYNVAVDILERMILACAVAGIDVKAPAFLDSIETVVDHIGNEYGDL